MSHPHSRAAAAHGKGSIRRGADHCSEADCLRRTIPNIARAGAALAVAGLIIGTAQALGAGAVVPAQPPCASKCTGPEALAILESGQPLSNVDVTTPLECRPACTFANAVTANHALFEKSVDLRGAKFKGNVELQGATFQAPALFQGAHFKTAVNDFSLATFSGLASFDNAMFAKADFSLTTFSGLASFVSATFMQNVDFSAAHFSDETDFGSTNFDAKAMFDSARFGKAASFLGAVIHVFFFNYVRSSGSVDFGQATFSCTQAQHEETTGQTGVEEGKNAESESGNNEPEDEAAKDEEPWSDEDDCTRAAENSDSADAEFTYSAFNDISFDQTTFDPGAQLDMDSFHASQLVFAPSDIHHVKPADRVPILGLIETSATSANDLGVANEAHYRRLALRSQSETWPLRVLDFVFYRSIAGYLVEPFQPLLTLLALALVMSFVRLHRTKLRRRVKAWQKRNARAPRPPAPMRAGSPRRPMASRFAAWTAEAWEALGRFGHELLDTLILMWPWSAAASAGRRFEATVYRVLFVCMLFGFAASNPTLRQMLDALH
jgi:uncharacterized protein YjbI with pentapeptide repeats